MRKIIAIACKELRSYWSAPFTWVLLAVFLAGTCAAVLGVSDLFAYRAMGVRPLLHWLPPSLLLLAAALTMRQLSGEQRAGTLDLLLALPISAWQVVLGKFLGVMGVLAGALALTLPIPLALALTGAPMWGPAAGGCAAGLLLAAVYTGLGLWLAALTDDPLAAFLGAVLAGGLLYIIGSPPVLAYAGAEIGPWLRAVLGSIGSGSRFAAAEHGVLDLRDLVYYGSLCGLFLLLTVCTLERKRWGVGPASPRSRRAAGTRLAVAGAGLLSLNLLLAPLRRLHIDLYGQGEPVQSVLPLNEGQEVSWELLTCALIVAGLLGAGAAALVWCKREKPLELSERDSYVEIGLIGE